MMEDNPEASGGKARRRPAAKAAARPAASKVKATVHLSVEADQRMNIHCAMMAMDRSALVEKLINDHLRRYVVQDRARPEGDASGEAAA